MKNLSYKNDIAGTAVGALCLLHCALTPMLFLSPNFIELSNPSSALFWWKNTDFLFLTLAFIAVFRSSSRTSIKTLKLVFWVSWLFLSIAILNERLAFFESTEIYIYLSSMLLVTAHLYNLKFCLSSKKL
tara:strand:+ start:4541 stop:4930 length:390 start_codon:yes stop_codon:yes gene_type:complete